MSASKKGELGVTTSPGYRCVSRWECTLAQINIACDASSTTLFLEAQPASNIHAGRDLAWYDRHASISAG